MRVLPAFITIAIAAIALPAPAPAVQKSKAEARGTVRPAPENYEGYMARRTGAFAAWYTDEDRLVSWSYRSALRFAECVAHFNKEAAGRALVSPIGGLDDRRSLVRLAEVNNGCAIDRRLVHPLLIRAALAETQLKEQSGGAVTPGASVGLPEVIDGYPVALISRCQVQFAPELVANLLSTTPGERAEREAADTLVARTASCGASKLGRLTATAARMAVVDAAYRKAAVGVSARP